MSDGTTPDGSPLMVDCGPHGKRVAAVVCCHMLSAQDRVVGFTENSSDPHDLQAWCEECEHMFQSKGEITEAFKKFNEMAVVCEVCYAELKVRHQILSGNI